jgi:membrane protease YdiL (CAAX protease family)
MGQNHFVQASLKLLKTHGPLLLCVLLPPLIWQWLSSQMLHCNTNAFSNTLWMPFCQAWQHSAHRPAFSLWMMLSYWLLYPLLEEYLFRRQLLMWLLDKTDELGFKSVSVSRWLANAVCSLIFVACHIPIHGVAMSLAVFFPSMLLGFVYLRYCNLILNSTVHGWWNFLYAVFSLQAF